MILTPKLNFESQHHEGEDERRFAPNRSNLNQEFALCPASSLWIVLGDIRPGIYPPGDHSALVEGLPNPAFISSRNPGTTPHGFAGSGDFLPNETRRHSIVSRSAFNRQRIPRNCRSRRARRITDTVPGQITGRQVYGRSPGLYPIPESPAAMEHSRIDCRIAGLRAGRSDLCGVPDPRVG